MTIYEEERANFYHHHFTSTILDLRSKEKSWDAFFTHLAGISHGCNLAQNELELPTLELHGQT